jgi:hypothetical protein
MAHEKEIVDFILRGMDTALKQLERFEKSVKGLSNEAIRIDTGKSVLALNTLGRAAEDTLEAISALGGEALESFAAYEQAGANVSTLTDDVAGLQTNIDAVTKDVGNAASKTELLTSSYDILSASIKDTDAVTTLLSQSTKGAVGGLSDSNTVANAASTIFNAYGGNLKSTAEQQAFLTDIISDGLKVQNEGKITLDQYAKQIGRAANTASTLSVEMDEVNAIFARTTKTGVPLGTAVAGINGVMKSFAKPTAEAAAEAEKLGIELSTKSLADKGITGLIEEIVQKSPDAAASMQRIFGNVRAFTVASSIAGDLEDSRRLVNLMADDTSIIDKQFKQVSSTTRGFNKAIKNLADDNLVDLGKGVELVIRPFKELAYIGLQTFASLPAPIKTAAGAFAALAGIASVTIAGLTTVVTILPSLVIGWNLLTAAITGNVVSTKHSTIVNAINASGLKIRAATLATVANATAFLGVVQRVANKELTISQAINLKKAV